MSSRPVCPRCGARNPATLAVCWKCGARLSSTFSSTFSYTRTWEETKRELDTSHTRQGLVILTISYTALAIIIAASVIDFLWGLLAGIVNLVAIVGGVLIVIGRDSFGRIHSRNTMLSVLFFVASIATIIMGRILYGAALALTRVPNGTIIYGNSTSSTVNPYLIRYITGMIATALIGLATVFLTYALHRKTGRIVLSISYFAFLTLSILTTALILQGFAITSSTTIDLSTLGGMRYQYQILKLLTVVPTLTFALTFFLALRRIKRGELPRSALETP